MKTTALTRLLDNAPTPALLIKDENPKWHNAAFSALSTSTQKALTDWAGNSHEPHLIQDGQLFERIASDDRTLVLCLSTTTARLQQTLIAQLLPLLRQGSDPFYVLPELLAKRLQWQQAVGCKLGAGDKLITVGDYRDGQYITPATELIKESPAARLYSKNETLALLPDTNGEPTWLAQRIDSPEGQPLGHLMLCRPADTAASLADCTQILKLCADIAGAWLGEEAAHAPQTPPQPQDNLTRLATRGALDDALKHCEQLYSRQGHDFELAMIDIDGLSTINNSLGQRTGDEVLKEFAHQLQHTCRSSDQIFRFGGDEFVVLFHQDDLAPAFEQRLERINHKMSKQLEQPFHSSYGMATLSEARGSGDELLLLADSRLRKSKSK